MDKNKTIIQLSKRLEELSEKHTYPNSLYDVFELDYETTAEALVQEGWGNIREFKKDLIQAYLTEGAAGVIKIMMEEV